MLLRELLSGNNSGFDASLSYNQGSPMKSIACFYAPAALALLLSGCGSSGNDNDAQTAPAGSAPPSVTTAQRLTAVSGTAATGAPFAGAAVSITDKAGIVVGTGTTTADGSYRVTLSADATPPFVIQAVRDDLTLTSVVADASSASINITPITTLIASRLSVSGDPSKLAAEFKANPSLISTTTVNASIADIVALLQPLFTAIGSTINPLTGTFLANGSGMDRVLDSLQITFTPVSTSTTNIEVAIRQLAAEGSQPATVQFSSQTATLPQLSAPAPATLVATGTATLIAELLQRLTACYALPVVDRVTTPDAGTALPSAIKAAECRALFVGNDPATYRDNGLTISGADRSKPFAGIYRTGATGLKFDRGAYQFSRANGDIVMSFRTTDTVGGMVDLALVARLTASDGKLRIIGNQYAYSGSVSAYQQLRTFLNQPAADHYSTGYAVSVPNNGQFSKVIVTSPSSRTITLVPSAGSGNLVIPINNVPTGTNFVRLRGEFADQNNTANPAAFETSLPYDPNRASNEEIAAIPANGVWRFDYYLVANTSTTPDATQHYRTQARALTIPEMKFRALSTLTNDLIADIKAKSATSQVVPLGNANSVFTLSWAVPTDGIAPTSLRLFGQGPSVGGTRIRFDDGIGVSSTARSGAIPCQSQSSVDNHCTSSGSGTVFANGSFASGFDLRGTDGPGRTFSHFYATYKIFQ